MSESMQLTAVCNSEAKTLGFPFNYAVPNKRLTRQNILRIEPVSSKVLRVNVEDAREIKFLKITNSSIRLWNDNWVDGNSQEIIDPQIQEMNLTNSDYLEIFSILLPRESLLKIDLSGCKNLKYFSAPHCSNLQTLFLNDCTSLENIILGYSKSIKYVSLRGCSLSETALEQFLQSYYPVQNGIVGGGQFFGQKTINYDAYLDLRGNIIPWTNRRIASKIRLLLCNAVAVVWSNNPPESVVPIELYRSLNI